MVKKLFKHEILAYLRTLLPIYGILAAVSLFTRITQMFESSSRIYNIVSGSSWFFYVVAVVVSLMLTVIIAITRFYKNLFTGEGYLTFTLPVTPTQHIWVKLFTAVLSHAVTLSLVVLSLLVVTEWEVLTEIGKAASYLVNHLPRDWKFNLPFFAIEGIVLIILSSFNSYLMYYTCIAVGQLTKKNRILAAVGIYFLFYAVSQIAGTVLIACITALHESPLAIAIISFCENHPISAVHIGAGIAALFTLILSAAFFLVTRYILRNKLNLE